MSWTTIAWRSFSTPAPTLPDQVAAPTVVAGAVYVGSRDGYLYSLDQATGELRALDVLQPDVATQPGGSDGLIRSLSTVIGVQVACEDRLPGPRVVINRRRHIANCVETLVGRRKGFRLPDDRAADFLYHFLE